MQQRAAAARIACRRACLLAALACLGVAAASPRAACAAAAAPADASDIEAATVAVIADVNGLRQRNQLPPLAANAALAQAAGDFAHYMARTGRYGHTADGRRPRDRANAQGYADCVVDENIGWIERSGPMSVRDLASAFYDGWSNSPPHRANMLDPDVVDTGVGMARSASGRWYGVQLFGRPRSAAITFSLTDAGSGPVHYRVGNQTYTVEPNVTQTHRLCRPATLVLEPGTASAMEITPPSGARYAAVPEGNGGWRLEPR